MGPRRRPHWEDTCASSRPPGLPQAPAPSPAFPLPDLSTPGSAHETCPSLSIRSPLPTPTVSFGHPPLSLSHPYPWPELTHTAVGIRSPSRPPAHLQSIFPGRQKDLGCAPHHPAPYLNTLRFLVVTTVFCVPLPSGLTFPERPCPCHVPLSFLVHRHIDVSFVSVCR